MSAQILDGGELAKQVKAEVKAHVEKLISDQNITPTLAVLQIGDDEAASGYARAIGRNCKSVGIAFRSESLPADATQGEAEARLVDLNAAPDVHGIMILEPVPDQIRLDKLIDRLDPAKDVDGVHPINAGRLLANRPPFLIPATPAGAMRMLDEAGIVYKGKQVVMVGRSDIVGKPMALLLLHNHCTVTMAHSRTVDLPGLCRTADILCVAVGRPEMVKGDWVRPGALVIDFGTNYTDDGLKGDCDQEGVAAVAGMMTPVPGGTGPMTNAMLMANVVEAAQRSVAS